MTLDASNLVFSGKSADKVRQYLEHGAKKGFWGPGSRLPGTDDLARELKVSSGTVKNVYRLLAKDGKLRTHAGIGSFWLGGDDRESKTYRIGLNLSVLPSDNTYGSWIHRIFGGVLRYKFESNANISLEPCGEFGEELEDSEERVSDLDETRRRRLDGLDGLLAFSSKELPEKLCDSHGREVFYVSIYPQGEQRNANFVAPDYFNCSRVLSEAWAKTGRKKILVVGYPSLSKSVSMRLRYCGMLAGLDEGGNNDADLRLVRAEWPCEQKEGEAAVEGFIKKTGWKPDAVYCVGDALAIGALKALQKLGYSIPEDVSVVGGNGIESAFVSRSLTSMAHPLEKIGSAMLEMLLRRIRSQGGSEVSRFEPVPFLVGSTTREVENEYLEKYSRLILPL